jgi:DNA invertase Pin-like site-specific DNA recombinase
MFKRPNQKKERVYGWKAKAPKFTPEEAESIREAHSKGVSYRELARLFKADKNTIMVVCRQRNAYSKYKQV